MLQKSPWLNLAQIPIWLEEVRKSILVLIVVFPHIWSFTHNVKKKCMDVIDQKKH